MIHFEKTKRGRFMDLGFLPLMWSPDDPRSAKEQVDANYGHGGGWQPLKGFIMTPSRDMYYPGDQPTRLLAVAKLRDEEIRFYQHDWVAIVQPDGDFEVARMD